MNYNSELHNYGQVDSIKRTNNSSSSNSKNQSVRSPKNSGPFANTKSRVYQGNTTYNNRVEESKKIIEENKKKGLASPKRFAVGGSPRGSPKSFAKERPPLASGQKVATVKKIKKVEPCKKTPNKKPREGFKSPTVNRKAPLISGQNKQGRNNPSTAFRSARRSRKERKAVVEQITKESDEMPSFPDPPIKHSFNPPENRFDYNNELCNTLNSELQEVECPEPTPVPQRFSQMDKERAFNDFSNHIDRLDERADIEFLHEETDFMQDDQAFIDNKLPIERQSITNSKVFSMSETEFRRFDSSNEMKNYIEVGEEQHPDFDDLGRES
jgi:hypothetical protein